MRFSDAELPQLRILEAQTMNALLSTFLTEHPPKANRLKMTIPEILHEVPQTLHIDKFRLNKVRAWHDHAKGETYVEYEIEVAE